jgi:NTP pyrophosphatase (non-canonical NTP hydrolase)
MVVDLEEIFNIQQKLVDKIKQDKPAFWTVETFEGYRIFMLCSFLVHEAVELQKETKWKWWRAKENYIVDEKNIPVELADLWHVLIQLTQEAGFNADDVMNIYKEKNKENVDRQERRY